VILRVRRPLSYRSACGLLEHGIEHLHDEALLRLGQALDALRG
jgi:hypothetical protein